MFSSHNPGYTHSQGLDRSMALIEMVAGGIFVPTAVLALLFVLGRMSLGF